MATEKVNRRHFDFMEENGLNEESLRALYFGKYKGASVVQVMMTNPSYLLWAHNNVSFFTLSDIEESVCDELVREEDEERDEIMGGYGYSEFWKD